MTLSTRELRRRDEHPARQATDAPDDHQSNGAGAAPGPELYRSNAYRVKSVLLGPPLRTSQLTDERVSKRVALAVFSSDPISSTAYATEQILLVLVTAVAAIRYTLPISLAIIGLLLLLVVSYRQVIAAYPSAGGAYVVSRDNFGNRVAALAGAALLIDYVLTVAVSVSGGVAAMVSVYPAELGPWQVELSIAFVALLALGNLRGLREAGRLFAVPTYVYVASVGVMIATGIVREATRHLTAVHYSATESSKLFHSGQALGSVGIFLILRAFAAGTTALTGVEAISNGVSAFKAPQVRNAKTTLLTMAVIMGSLFLGVSWLAERTQVQAYQTGFPTVISQVAKQVLGSGLGHVGFLVVQVSTLLILVLAANTSFSGFPLLASFAAGDALLPRQLRKRGHRLVYSNGIIVLAAIAVVLIVAFRARTNSLIPLYAIGVVTSFTLSQAGMTKRHLTQRAEGWRYGIAINGGGAVVTAIVLAVIVITKFSEGAWMVVVAIPVLVALLLRIQATYGQEMKQLKLELSQRLPPPKPRHEVLVLVNDLDKSALAALVYARQLNPLSITAVHLVVDPDHARELTGLWARSALQVSLEVIDAPDRNLAAAAAVRVIESVRRDTEVTVLVPRRAYRSLWSRVLHDRTSFELVKVLGGIENVNVTIVPYRLQAQSSRLVARAQHASR